MTAPMPAIESIELNSGAMSLQLLTYGAVTQSWRVDGVEMILGYDKVEDYQSDPFYIGAIAGPVANRIGGATFTHDGQIFTLQPNEGANVLHSGADGLSSKIWTVASARTDSAKLIYDAPDGEAGFPGASRFEITVTLSDEALIYEMRAEVEQPRPVSLAQHNYYCLGQETGADLALTLPARGVLTLDKETIATGAIDVPADAGLDFERARRLGDTPKGIDRFFVFDDKRDASRPVATLEASTGMGMEVYSDQPGAQVYTGHGLGAPFQPWQGICIEPSGYPNAVNQPRFPSMICTPEAPYTQRLMLEVLS